MTLSDSYIQVRELIAQAPAGKYREFALRAFRGLEADEWYNCIPLSRAQMENILSCGLPIPPFVIPREGETEAQTRARCLLERLQVEDLKRSLMWKFVFHRDDGDPVELKKAEDFADQAHAGQYRDSGEPYIIHPLTVADIIIDLGLMDSDAVIAGILHDVVEDSSSVSLDDIERNFGSSVAALVDGVTKLTKASDTGVMATKEQQQAESVRKMFLAMAKDIRVIPIKLADRLHNMRTLEYCKSDKRIRKAKETLEIYAPLAHRLGMGQLKCELEDLSFAQLEPEIYADISEKLKKLRIERGDFLRDAMETIKKRLDESGIKATINGRPKHIYSIYKKLVKQGTSFEEVYDLLAIRVIVGTIEDCYHVLGLVHSMWRPLPFRIKDYISTPKPNGYKSLHTTLIGDNGMPFEVQIRTQEMHNTAEFGIAAHWKYKEGREQSNDLDLVLNWVRQLMNDKIEDSDEFMRVLKFDFFSDYVFVFTPNGKIMDLVTGSTPIDFAYRIHSEVGNRCVGAKINNRLVPLDTELKMGDIVEIITSSTLTGPRRDWLKIVKTQQARSKIRQWFKKELKDENIDRGKLMLESEARHNGFSLPEVLDDEKAAQLFKKLSVTSIEDLYAAIGHGSISTGQVIPRLAEDYKKLEKEQEAQKLLEQMREHEAVRKRTHRNLKSTVLVSGEPDMQVRLAKCCAPVPGDDIVGYITRGRGVSVHRADCSNVISLQNAESVRFVDVEWANSASSDREFTAHLQLTAYNRTDLVFDVSQLFISMNISISSFNARSDKKGNTQITLDFDVKDSEQLDFVQKQVYKIKGVTEVFRVQA